MDSVKVAFSISRVSVRSAVLVDVSVAVFVRVLVDLGVAEAVPVGVHVNVGGAELVSVGADVNVSVFVGNEKNVSRFA